MGLFDRVVIATARVAMAALRVELMPYLHNVAVDGRSRAAGRHRFQKPWDGMRNARLKREDAFSHAMIIVSSAMVSSS